MDKIFLDSCVWINYIWQTQFSEQNKRENNSTKLIKIMDGDNNFQIILSPFLINEISSHFRDWFILKKVIIDGFSYREFNREKKNYKLTEKEMKQIDEIIIKIGKIENVNSLSLKGLKQKEMEEVLNLEATYYFDFYDALHIHTAVKNKCKYFITKDGPIRKLAQTLDSNNPFKIECLPPKTFCKIILKNF